MVVSPSPASGCHQVAVIGAGNVGSMVAQRLAEKNLADVVLLDVLPGRAEGIALDLMQARAIERHDRRILGTQAYQDIQGSDLVVITAGLPRKPGMSRDDLLLTNAQIVQEATRQVMVHAPQAILLVVTNPLDVMSYLAWHTSGLLAHRVMGMGGVLDSARFQTFLALELGVLPSEVSAIVLGGHGDLMVPLPRYSTVKGVPVTELLNQATLDRLVARTRNGGSEIVELLKTGGAYFAPASAVALMVEAILANHQRILPCSAHLQGEYGLGEVFLGVPCRLGSQGIEAIVELTLTEAEQAALQASAQTVKQNLDRLAHLLNSMPAPLG